MTHMSMLWGRAMPAARAQIAKGYRRVTEIDSEEVLHRPSTKVYPYTSRPHGRLFVY